MALEIRTGTNYGNQDTLDAAGTAQRLGSGSRTFVKAVGFVTVTYVDKDVWVAKSAEKAEAEATGAGDDRVFVKAETTGLTLPWGFEDVFFVNAVTAETPTIYVAGHD